VTQELYDKAILLKAKQGGLSIPLLQMKLKISYKLAKEILKKIYEPTV